MKKSLFAFLPMLFIGIASCTSSEEVKPERTKEQIEAEKDQKRLEELTELNDEIGEEIVDEMDHIIRLKKISSESDVTKNEARVDSLRKEQDKVATEIDEIGKKLDKK